MDSDSKSAYIEGRMYGLKKLIDILKDAVTKSPQADAALVATLVLHISQEMDSIIGDMKDLHGPHPVFSEGRKAAKEMGRAAKEVDDDAEAGDLEEHVSAADDLMKNLMAVKAKKKQ